MAFQSTKVVISMKRGQGIRQSEKSLFAVIYNRYIHVFMPKCMTLTSK